MKELPSNIENLPKVSPLLNDEIIEKDYTKDINLQSEPVQETPPPTADTSQQQAAAAPPPPTEEPKKTVEDYTIDPEAAKMEDHTRGFSFDQTGEPSVDGTTPPSYDDSGQAVPITDEYKLPEASAKEFAEMVTHAFAIYVPQASYTFVKIDMNNIKFHVEKGNIEPKFESVFRECNRNTERDLQFSDEELQMFQNSLQKYLEYKNVSFANPETAFWGTVAILGTKQIYLINKLMKANQKLVYDVIMETNPDYKVKKEKEPETEVVEPEVTETKQGTDETDEAKEE